MVYDNLIHNQESAGKLARVLIGNPFTYPEVWHTVAYFSSWFVFIPAVVVIMFITNEYTFKTHRQNIIDGWSRQQFVSSKLIDVSIVSLLITFLYFAVSLVTGFANQEGGSLDIWSQFYYTGLFALQTFAQLSIAFFVGFLVRKAFIALGIFLFYYIIFEPIIVGLLRVKANDIGRFMPLEISDRMIPVPAFLGRFDQESYNQSLSHVREHALYTVILTAIIWLLCYRIHSRRDL
jgi:ABC-type transport system involved in multi-copper enzyme maturation permease subunit